MNRSEELNSIHFRDEYIVIETTHKTYSIKHSDMGDIVKGWVDNIHACGLSIAKFPYLRSKFYNTDRE